MSRETQSRAVQIATKYVKNVRRSDAVLVFVTPSFLFTLGCFLLIFAKLYHVPLFLKPLGTELSRYLRNQTRPVRISLLLVLRAATGVLAQTRQLKKDLEELGCTNTHYVPGYRPAIPSLSSSKRDLRGFTLVFLSQIERAKGPLLLLEALRILAHKYGLRVGCDFYGPILNEERREFLSQLELTPGAIYRGVAPAGTSSQLMAGYDALVFPTYYLTEGQPGVIIEAMQSGIPVISTQYQAATELITDGENGFLVPMGDGNALASAIRRLALDVPLREKMGRANYQRGQEFRSDRIVARMIGIIFPGICPDNRS